MVGGYFKAAKQRIENLGLGAVDAMDGRRGDCNRARVRSR